MSPSRLGWMRSPAGPSARTMAGMPEPRDRHRGARGAGHALDRLTHGRRLPIRAEVDARHAHAGADDEARPSPRSSSQPSRPSSGSSPAAAVRPACTRRSRPPRRVQSDQVAIASDVFLPAPGRPDLQGRRGRDGAETRRRPSRQLRGDRRPEPVSPAGRMPAHCAGHGVSLSPPTSAAAPCAPRGPDRSSPRTRRRGSSTSPLAVVYFGHGVSPAPFGSPVFMNCSERRRHLRRRAPSAAGRRPVCVSIRSVL